jgi:hypothetical protein
MKNQLNFYQLNSSETLLKAIYPLQLTMTYDILNRNNLSPDLFKRIKYLGLTGVLNGIQHDLFKSFTHLKQFDLVLSNLKEFFHMDERVKF